MGDEKGLTFGDGFKFGLGFFTAGLVFYIIIIIITFLLLVGMIGSMMHHW